MKKVIIHAIILLSVSIIYAQKIDSINALVNSDFNIHETINLLGYYKKDDGGGAKYIIKSKSNLVQYKNEKTIQLKEGKIAILLKRKELSSKVFGIFPDGKTDWRKNKKMSEFLKYCSQHNIIALFEKGVYNCALDNTYSNLTIRFNEGSIFTGTVHIAVQNKITAETPIVENVKALGILTSYSRVGTYNCNNIYIEKIKLINSPDGKFKSNGVHFYYNTNNLTIDEIYVEDSGNKYGISVDGLDKESRPKNILLKKVIIDKSQTNGSYFHAFNLTIEDLQINSYGENNVNAEMKQKEYFGFKLFRSENIVVKKLNVVGKLNSEIPMDNIKIWDCKSLKIYNLVSELK